METRRSAPNHATDEIHAALQSAPAAARLVCAILAGESSSAEALTLAKSTVWQDALRFARSQHLVPLLYTHLLLQDLPESPVVRTTMRDSYYQHMLYNTRHYNAMLQVIRSLQAGGLDVIALKGVFISSVIHRNPATRRSADLDILIRSNDLESASQALVKLGYEPRLPISFDNGIPATHLRAHHLPGFRKEGSPWVEVHFNLAPPAGPFHIDVDGLWHRSHDVDLDGVPTLALCPIDLLLHLCIHTAYHHAFAYGLIQLYDIAAVIRHYEKELDWDAFITRAHAWRAAKSAYISLLLATGLLNANVPQDVLAELCPEEIEDDLRTWAVRQVLSEGISEGHQEEEAATSNLIANPWLRFKRTLRSVFPSHQTMAYIYPLDERPFLLPFYYVLRLFQLLQHYGRRSWDVVFGDHGSVEGFASKVAYHTFRNWLVD